MKWGCVLNEGSGAQGPTCPQDLGTSWEEYSLKQQKRAAGQLSKFLGSSVGSELETTSRDAAPGVTDGTDLRGEGVAALFA